MRTTVYKFGGFYAEANAKNPELFHHGTSGDPIFPKLLRDGRNVDHNSVKGEHFVQEFDPYSFVAEEDKEEKKHAEDVPAYNLRMLPAGADDNHKIVYLPYYDNNITSTTIRSADESVRYFMTDKLSGCKVYIDRRPNGDLVCYHANAQHKPKEAEATMDSMHSTAQRGDVNLFSLSQDVYYARALALEKEEVKGQTDRKFKGGTTVMGFRADNGQWEFWYQTYGRIVYKDTSIVGQLKGMVKPDGKDKEVKLKKVKYEIIDSGRLTPT